MTPVDNKHNELNPFNQFLLHFRYFPDKTFLLNFMSKYFSVILTKASEHLFSKSKACVVGSY